LGEETQLATTLKKVAQVENLLVLVYQNDAPLGDATKMTQLALHHDASLKHNGKLDLCTSARLNLQLSDFPSL
jgi:hypothetical protein